MSPWTRIFAGALFWTGISSVGCATLGTLQTADTVGEGNSEVAIETSVWGVSVAGGGGIGSPVLGFAARFGVSDRVDIGGRFTTLGGLELLTKFQLTPPASKGIILALAPSGGGIVVAASGGAAGLVHFEVPLIMGIRVGEGSQLVIAPKVQEWLAFGAGGGSGAGVSLTSFGGSLGYSARLGPSFRLLPEVSALVPSIGSVGVSGGGGDTEIAAGNATLFQVSLGFLIGGPKPVAKAE